MGIEHWLLIITTVAGVLKAYFEAQKAKAEAARANEAEACLSAAVVGLEDARGEMPDKGAAVIRNIQKKTVQFGVANQFNDIVKELTKGDGEISKVTRGYSKTRLVKTLETPGK